LPDLFEVRLDALSERAGELSRSLDRLRAPLIITARHPAEGGQNALSAARRGALLLEFLPRARYVDIELRSVGPLAAVVAEARRLEVQLIISAHDFRCTPEIGDLRTLADRARAASADIFKLATRVETSADLARLIAGFEALKTELPVSAMGIGALGRQARRALLARGSVLNYAHLGTAQVEGQFSLAELRRLASCR
jgi:3-dehydroquinate dehydratase-1